MAVIITFSIGANYAFAEFESNEPIITVQMNGPSTFYLDVPSQIIRATVEIQYYTPSDGIYFMKVTHLPTQKVMRDFDIYPRASGNDLWSVQIAYPFLESDIKIGDQTFLGEFEIHIRTEKGSQTASTKFSILEFTDEHEPEPESIPVPHSSPTPSEPITPSELTKQSVENLVTITKEATVPGCDTTKSCVSPYHVTINVGEEVTWFNEASRYDRLSSGYFEIGETEVFSISIPPGGTASHKFLKAGEFQY